MTKNGWRKNSLKACAGQINAGATVQLAIRCGKTLRTWDNENRSWWWAKLGHGTSTKNSSHFCQMLFCHFSTVRTSCFPSSSSVFPLQFSFPSFRFWSWLFSVYALFLWPFFVLSLCSSSSVTFSHSSYIFPRLFAFSPIPHTLTSRFGFVPFLLLCSSLFLFLYFYFFFSFFLSSCQPKDTDTSHGHEHWLAEYSDSYSS